MTDRGLIHALEMIPIVLIWLLLFQSALYDAGQTKRDSEQWIAHDRTWERARSVSDALVHRHGETPWKGCAVFSEEKKRVMEYVISRACITALEHEVPAFIGHVRVRTPTDTIHGIERSDANTSRCASVQTPVLIAGENEIGVLEVSACE